MLYNIFVIHFGSGKILFEKNSAELAKDTNLFSAIFSTLNLLAREIHIGELSNFRTNEFNFIISATEDILVVLILDSNEEIKTWHKIAYEINNRFKKKYSPIDVKSSITNYYADFYEDIKPLLSELDDNNIKLDVGLLLREKIGGDLHVITSKYFDFVLDLGAREIFHDFRNLIFVKILDNEKAIKQVEDSLKFCQNLEILDNFCTMHSNLMNYFPTKIIFIGDNISNELIYDLKRNSNYSQNGLFIKSNKLDQKFKDLTFFKCKVEIWKKIKSKFEIFL
jgi:hypothetical protein